MKLVCISTKVYVNPCDEVELYSSHKQWKYLTLNKEYECIDVVCNDSGEPEEYEIIADDDRKGMYPIANFTSRWEVRDSKLNELGI
jgi:hypothetical protein